MKMEAQKETAGQESGSVNQGVEKKKKQRTDFRALLAEKDKIIEEHVNQLKRLQAEFENYIKRTEKEREHFACLATEKVVVKLLRIVDDFERALEQMKKNNIDEEMAKGISMILGQMHKVLEEENVCPIKCVGEKFDPYKHEAITFVEHDGVPENTVVEELQKGYTMAGKVIRCSKVKITKKSRQEGDKK